MDRYAKGQLVKISTERLVETNTAGHATADKGKKREKRGETENRTRIGLERVLSGKMAGHGLDGERACDSWRLSRSLSSSRRSLGLITISARSALTIGERLMRARDGLLTSPSDSAAEREQISLTAIAVTFSVGRSGFEQLGKMLGVATDAGRSEAREISDILAAVDWMLRGMLESLSVVAQRIVKATGWRAKQVKQLEGLVEEECDRTFGTLTEAVLVRLVRLIFPWTERMFDGSDRARDIPMELVGMLEGALAAVERFGPCGGAASVRERVAREVCHEIGRLPRTERIPADGGGKSVRERRRRLARKDGVWYLGVVLQSCAASTGIAARVVDSARVARLGAVETGFLLGRTE